METDDPFSQPQHVMWANHSNPYLRCFFNGFNECHGISTTCLLFITANKFYALANERNCLWKSVFVGVYLSARTSAPSTFCNIWFHRIVLTFLYFRSPPEKQWSYRCINHRCVRQHFSNKGEKRTTFLTCSMLCGSQSLWPEPSIKSLIGTNAVSFHLNDVQYKVQTPFKGVESLTESAFSVFVDEVRQIVHASGGVSAEASKSSTRSFRDNSYTSSTRAGTTTSHIRNSTSVNIYVNVVKTSDVHLTLSTDECYNITMTSKSSPWFNVRHCFNHILLDEHQAIDVRISANTFFGARHGLSTLQQLIWFDDEDDTLKIISTAHIVDCPKFP